MTVTTTEPPRRRLAAPARRAAILEAANAVFGATGYHAATTRDIAAAAGVSEALLYQHFATKRDLFQATVEAASANLEARLLGAAASADPLAAAVDGFFRFVESESGLYRVFFQQALQADAAFQSLYAGIAGRMVALAEKSLSRGLPEAEAEPVAHALAGMVSQLALWWVDLPEGRRPPLGDVSARALRMARAAYTSMLEVD